MSLQLTDLHGVCLELANVPLQQRLETLCKLFLDTPYGAWLNGSSITALDDFNYQFDLLDCVLFVEVVLALAKVEPKLKLKDFETDFATILQKLHYKNGVANFLNSNHFMCVDWIPNNNFMVTDITARLFPDCKIAETTIDKLAWVERHKILQEDLSLLTDDIKMQLQPVSSKIFYIDTEDLLNNQDYFQAVFPEYAIVNIVRPNWDIRDRIGTALNISHLGFTFKHQNIPLSFYHATIEKMLVVKTTLFDYMQHHRASPTIRGINVLAIHPGYYHAR